MVFAIGGRGVVGTSKTGHTLENSHSRREVVDAARGAKSGGDDGGRGDEIVGEAVVEVPLALCQFAALSRPLQSPPEAQRVMPGQPPKPCVTTYLELENIVHLVKFLLVSAVKK